MSNILNQDKGFNVSEKYVAVRTQGLIETLENRGFFITAHSKSRVNNPAKEGFQKHLVRMAHDNLELNGVGDSRPELVIVNSHDGLSSVRLMLGIFRLVCSNGLIVGNTFGGYNIRHSGNAIERLDVGLVALTDSLPMIAETIKQWSSIKLTDNQARLFASEASNIVLPSKATPKLDTLLQVRRAEDNTMDLWTVYNRIQETLVRGGLHYETEMLNPDGLVVKSRNRTRAIKSIDKQVRINKELWDLTSEVSKVAA